MKEPKNIHAAIAGFIFIFTMQMESLPWLISIIISKILFFSFIYFWVFGPVLSRSFLNLLKSGGSPKDEFESINFDLAGIRMLFFFCGGVVGGIAG